MSWISGRSVAKRAIHGQFSLAGRKGAVLATLCLSTLAASARAESVAISKLDLSKATQGWERPQADRSVDRHTMSIGGKSFATGVGAHARFGMYVQLDGQASEFTATVGVDDEIKNDPNVMDHPLEFQVICDDKVAYRSGLMHVGDAAKPVRVDLKGVRTMVLVVRPGGQGVTSSHADWAEAMIAFAGAAPVAISPPVETAEILTPKPAATPRINGAHVVGVRPGHPLLFLVATTGDRSMQFAADNLPEGLSLDAATGRLTGSVKTAGDYPITVHAKNAVGSADAKIRVVVGDKIALTPPMGWNSWNCFAEAVSEEKVRAAADAMVTSGLINHGWTYINIDDCWAVRNTQPLENRRTAEGRVKTNAKFPDMKALTDDIHAKGLRAGIYSSPGRGTCANYDGSYQFEAQDAKQYAEWGFDYLKYDWCQYGGTADDIRHSPNRPSELEILQHPYRLMSGELLKQDRDIVFSLCQYGMGDVWKWGDSVGGQVWRTTGDIDDSWASVEGIGFGQNGHEVFAGPGHWNDPDMLVVGKVGWGPALHPTRLTPNEQYTHISLWSLLASPLLIGCDMTQMDDFTFSLLTNDEVIAVNQDSLGQQAKRVSAADDTEIWVKDLEDGSKAVGLFNRGEVATQVTVSLATLGLSGSQDVRDLWRQKSVATTDKEFVATVARHGAVLVKISPATKDAK